MSGPPVYRTRFETSAAMVPLWLEALEEEGLSVGAFEIAEIEGEDSDRWAIELLHNAEPDAPMLQARLDGLAHGFGEAPVRPVTEAVPPTDWLEATRRSFPPLRAGRFYVHGSHVEEDIPAGCLAIRVDAGLAFGSGEHGSTQGCLRLLDGLPDEPAPRAVLDMGCGSGILALAALRRWPDASALAVDNDARSVAVAIENARDNGVSRGFTGLVSEGFVDPAIAAAGPFDLVLANILADPLIAMAGDLSFHLAPRGHLILAGLLLRQRDTILRAFAGRGLVETDRHLVGNWASLRLAKGR
ncbi:50S ribosomal protein L11 methyltransferase [Marinivivus vitaminiproducens]|uniref:50S ribosomal protein L11 methyltransferase n=1 Tax=Marinivivus vitaminiproducens TaxID=3035935 RepID=UPI0027A871B1|nr:50S ribosomal protein L11 methyltransferase [Geminicoccaceae bacterium SCSIO 64248]